jgi:hypothetical protein
MTLKCFLEDVGTEFLYRVTRAGRSDRCRQVREGVHHWKGQRSSREGAASFHSLSLASPATSQVTACHNGSTESLFVPLGKNS